MHGDELPGEGPAGPPLTHISDEDLAELARLLGYAEERGNGASIPPGQDYYGLDCIDRAEGRTPSVHGDQDADVPW